jgi:macrodomain Ter protein organizer (MatP/YcbG family)
MQNKKTIVLNGLDVVTNRKMISIKLPIWKKLISCSRHEQITTTKLIDKLITKYIEDNNYDIEKIFNNNLEVKQEVLSSLIDYDFNTQEKIEYK